MTATPINADLRGYWIYDYWLAHPIDGSTRSIEKGCQVFVIGSGNGRDWVVAVTTTPKSIIPRHLVADSTWILKRCRRVAETIGEKKATVTSISERRT